MINTDEVLDAITSAKSRGCEVLVLVIPISKEVLHETTYTQDELYHSVKGAAEKELRRCLNS